MAHIRVHQIVVNLHPRLKALNDVVPHHWRRQVAHLDARISPIGGDDCIVQHLAASLVRQLQTVAWRHKQVPLHRHGRVVEVETITSCGLTLVVLHLHRCCIGHRDQPIAIALGERVVLNSVVSVRVVGRNTSIADIYGVVLDNVVPSVIALNARAESNNRVVANHIIVTVTNRVLVIFVVGPIVQMVVLDVSMRGPYSLRRPGRFNVVVRNHMTRGSVSPTQNSRRNTTTGLIVFNSDVVVLNF